MRNSIFIVSLAFLLFSGCVETPSGPGDVTVDDSASTSSESETRTASLQAASPAEGSVVSGEFLLAAVVDGEAKVRFLLDGSEVAELDQRPYQIGVDGCEMSTGNHFFVVEIEDRNGEIQDLEQWFTLEACD